MNRPTSQLLEAIFPLGSKNPSRAELLAEVARLQGELQVAHRAVHMLLRELTERDLGHCR